MNTLSVVAALALHAFALFGYGRFALRRAGYAGDAAAMSVALGLAVVVVLGGVLNLTRMAALPSPFIVLGVGVVLGLAAIPWSALPQMHFSVRGNVVVFACVFVLALLLLCATILPTPTFNYYDDLQKYFAHPVRMLETGTLFGSPLSALGFETLGGQAYLHGFVLSLGPMDMLHAADCVLAFLLLLGLLGTAPTQLVAPRWIAMAAAGLINPQIVNVSSTYTGAALGAALLLMQLDANAGSTGSAVLAGIVLGALCALKSSLVLYALVLGLSLSLARLACAGFQHCARWSLACAGTTCACLAPWVLTHFPHLLLIREHRSPPPSPSLAAAYTMEPFSWQSWGYGTGFAPYTYALLGLLLLASLAFWRGRPRSHVLQVSLWFSVGLMLLYVCMLYVIGPVSQGELTMLRLFAPMLIGALPASYVLMSGALSGRSRRSLALIGVLSMAPLLGFVPFALERMQRALVDGSVFVVAKLDRAPWYRELNRYVLHGRMRDQVRTAQAAIPAGAPLVAWVGAPFWLDYERNPVAEIDMAGLETPWSRIPDTRYVLWEFAGATTGQLKGFEEVRRSSGLMAARIGDAGLRFTRALLTLEPRPKLLWNDGQFLVFELRDETQLRERYLTTRIDTEMRAPGAP